MAPFENTTTPQISPCVFLMKQQKLCVSHLNAGMTRYIEQLKVFDNFLVKLQGGRQDDKE